MAEIQKAVKDARENPLPGHGGSRDGAGRQADEDDALADLASAVIDARSAPLTESVGSGGKNQGDNITLKSMRGTDQTYTLRRLARDRPDLLDRIEAGELSPNAAAVRVTIIRHSEPIRRLFSAL